MFVIFLSVSRVAFNYIASLINGLHKFTAIETGRCANMRIIQNATEPTSESENKKEASNGNSTNDDSNGNGIGSSGSSSSIRSTPQVREPEHLNRFVVVVIAIAKAKMMLEALVGKRC